MDHREVVLPGRASFSQRNKIVTDCRRGGGGHVGGQQDTSYAIVNSPCFCELERRTRQTLVSVIIEQLNVIWLRMS